MHVLTFDSVELLDQIFPSRQVVSSVAYRLRTLLYCLPAALQTGQFTDILKAFLHFLDTTEESGIVHLSGYTHWASTHSALTGFVNIYFHQQLPHQ